ncbi:hypothetical protein HDU83_008887 [Entophlyctis luteolus]|nr:hypothetical protein HDU83_008887 [Entophlyctis luteolus]
MHGPDARAPARSAAITAAAAGMAVAAGGSVDRAREVAILKRAANETRVWAGLCGCVGAPEHLAVLGGDSSAVRAIGLLPRNAKLRKPVAGPQTEKQVGGTVRTPKEVKYVPPSIPRLFVQITDLRVKNWAQEQQQRSMFIVPSKSERKSSSARHIHSRKSQKKALASLSVHAKDFCCKFIKLPVQLLNLTSHLAASYSSDIPTVDPPTPYPILIQLHKGPPPPQHTVQQLQAATHPPITRLVKPPNAAGGRSGHRRRKSNDSVAHSIASIKSTLSTFKQNFIRGFRSGRRGDGESGTNSKINNNSNNNNHNSSICSNSSSSNVSGSSTVDASGGVPMERCGGAGTRATLGIASPFRTSKISIASTASSSTRSICGPTTTGSAAEPVYAVPCYHGPTLSLNDHNYSGGYMDDGQDQHQQQHALTIPESLLGQVVLAMQTSGETKSTFERVIPTPIAALGLEEDSIFGIKNLAIGKKNQSDRAEVATVSVQVGLFLDESYPLVAEIPSIEYSTFLNFQMQIGGGTIWKKYWVVIAKGVMRVYDFEYKTNRPMVSRLPLQSHVRSIVRPDADEMCAMNCLQINFCNLEGFEKREAEESAGEDDGEGEAECEGDGFGDSRKRKEKQRQWRVSVVEAGERVYVTSDSKDGQAEAEAVLREFEAGAEDAAATGL